MFNRNSFQVVKKSVFHKGRFVKPLYDNYCFSNILPAMEALLTKSTPLHLPADVFSNDVGRYKNIVLFLVDGFGWQMFKKARQRSLALKRIARRGVVSQLIAQFPSTTAAAMTTIHTGLPVGKHGIYEWFYYEPLAEAIISPLIFSFAEDKIRNTLQGAGLRPEVIFPKTTFYKHLKKMGIQSRIFMHQEYWPSPYADVLMKDAKIVPYKTFVEGLTDLLASSSANTKKPTYTLFYFDKVDSLAHKYGSASPYCEAGIDAFFFSLEKSFLNKQKKNKDTLILITADHGQIDIDPGKTIYLNEEIPLLENKIQKTKDGKLIIPVGGCRDMFLRVKEEFLEEVYSVLRTRLKDTAHVFKISELVKGGFFGPVISPYLLSERCGNLMIAPYKNNLVWWNKNKIFTIKHKSHHGGLSKEEMLIPFISLVI